MPKNDAAMPTYSIHPLVVKNTTPTYILMMFTVVLKVFDVLFAMSSGFRSVLEISESVISDH